jgi:hypothetical protein
MDRVPNAIDGWNFIRNKFDCVERTRKGDYPPRTQVAEVARQMNQVKALQQA